MKFDPYVTRGLWLPHNTGEKLWVPQTLSEEESEKPEKDLSIVKDPLAYIKNILNSVTDSVEGADNETSKIIIKEVEGLLGLYVAFVNAANWTGAIASLFLYVRHHFEESIAVTLCEYITEVIDISLVEPQSDGDNFDEKPAQSWLQLLTELKENWEHAKNNRFFSHFSKLLGLIVTAGLCKAQNLEFEIGKFKLAQPDLAVVHGSAVDVADAALSTVVYFGETFSACMESGSLMPLVLDNKKNSEYAVEYATLVSTWELIKNGNLKRSSIKITEHEFDMRLRILTQELKDLTKETKNFESRIIHTYFLSLIRIRNDYINFRLNAGNRKAPFAFCTHGPSCQGKSVFVEGLIDALLISNGECTDASLRHILNPSEKHMSGLKTDTNVIMIDDFGNVDPKFLSQAPTEILIQLINNAPFIAPMADIDEKAKIAPHPSIVSLTTNDRGLSANATAVNPYAIQRRIQVYIELHAKKEFQKVDENGNYQGLDSAKALEHTAGQANGIDDIWEVSLTIVQKPRREDLMSKKFTPIKDKYGKKMTKVSVGVAVECMIDLYKSHNVNQERLMERKKNRFERIKKCPTKGCCYMRGMCQQHDAVNDALEKGTSDDSDLPDLVATPNGYEDDDEDEDVEDVEDVTDQAKSDESWYQKTIGKLLPGINIIPKENWYTKTVEKLLPGIGVSFLTYKAVRAVERERWRRIHLTDLRSNFPDPVAFPVLRNEKNLRTNPSGFEPESGDFGETVLSGGKKAWNIVSRRVQRDLFGFESMAGVTTSAGLIMGAKYFESHFDWLSLVPIPWARNPNFQNFMCLMNRGDIKKRYMLYTSFLWTGIMASAFKARTLAPTWSVPIISATTIAGIITQSTMKNFVVRRFRENIVKRASMDDVISTYKKQHASKFIKSAVIVAVLIGVYKVYKAFRDQSVPQGLTPSTPQELKAADAKPDSWFSGVTGMSPLPTFGAARTIVPNDLCNIVKKNLFHVIVKGDNGSNVVGNALALHSNTFAMCKHYFRGMTSATVILSKTGAGHCGGKMEFQIDVKNIYMFPNTDACVVWTSKNSFPIRGLRKWLPLEPVKKFQFSLFHREQDSSVLKMTGIATGCTTDNNLHDVIGGTYDTLSADTFKGMCGSVLVAAGAGACIAGLHVGGLPGAPKGCFTTFTTHMYDEAIIGLRKLNEGFVITGSNEGFDGTAMGETILLKEDPHPKSPLKYIPESNQFVVHGTCPGRCFTKNTIVDSVASEQIKEVMGVDNLWGPPTYQPDWFGAQQLLAKASEPVEEYEVELLNTAIRDFITPLENRIREPMWKEDVKPLTDDETVNGIAGKKFIDKIKTSTAIGPPLGGKKTAYLKEETIPHSDGHDHIEFTDEIMQAVYDAREKWKRGERSLLPAKVNKKMEALPKSKEKQRMIFNLAFPILFEMKRLGSPIARFLHLNPELSESMVGINCEGPDWDSAMEFMATHGLDRAVGGDYSAYDARTSSQMILAAFSCFRKLMVATGNYSDEDLTIFESMAGDIAYAIIMCEGDLIELTSGLHVSGNALTVDINGIIGALNLRCVFYTLYPKTPTSPLYRDNVNIAVYGDDNAGTVSSRVPLFHMGSISKILGSYGWKYTDPDKNSVDRDFLGAGELSFLKRKNVFHPKLDAGLGALEEDSIFKMLHNLNWESSSGNTKEMQSAMNIDTALDAWFCHGEQIFESRRQQLKIVAELSELASLCRNLDLSYDDKVKKWNNLYYPDK